MADLVPNWPYSDASNGDPKCFDPLCNVSSEQHYVGRRATPCAPVCLNKMNIGNVVGNINMDNVLLSCSPGDSAGAAAKPTVSGGSDAGGADTQAATGVAGAAPLTKKTVIIAATAALLLLLLLAVLL